MAAAAATAGLGLSGRRAYANSWAEAPLEASKILLGTGVKAERMLEIFCYGGVGPWETFYVVDAYGTPDYVDPAYRNQQWYLFANDHASVFGGDCGLTDPTTWLLPWTTDSLGMSVSLGPIVMPVRDRPDILERMRVVVMNHDLEPHEAAIPLALSGMRLGNIRMAGMGAHVQRYHQDRDLTGRVTPWSYICTPDTEISTDNLRVASSVGVHPGSARPLSLKVTSNSTLTQLLERNILGADRSKVDALLSHYADATRNRYATLKGEHLRSMSIDDHDFALASLLNAPNLSTVFGPDFLATFGGASCDDSSSEDFTGMGLEAAVHLLTHPTDPAKYVNVIDGGLIPADGGGGYDTHFVHLPVQARNLMSMLTNLVQRINEPGENDPAKLNLDDTLIALTMEFGRTPFIQAGDGTNHHPYGYVNILIGGPIGPDQAGVVGGIGPDGTAVDYVTPAELRAALLAGMGMYPFSHESFAVGDIRDVPTELDALVWLQEHVLGRPI